MLFLGDNPAQNNVDDIVIVHRAQKQRIAYVRRDGRNGNQRQHTQHRADNQHRFHNAYYRAENHVYSAEQIDLLRNFVENFLYKEHQETSRKEGQREGEKGNHQTGERLPHHHRQGCAYCQVGIADSVNDDIRQATSDLLHDYKITYQKLSDYKIKRIV